MDTAPDFLQEKYDAIEFIDNGASGWVYKCTRDGVTTAVKVLVPLNPVVRKRFEREIEILRHIDHENVVRAIDAGETDGYHWYESEYANAGHFGAMYGFLFYSDMDRVNYFRQICLGVQALHRADPRVIHRDLKPRNILVFEQPGGNVTLKIADFGIAAISGDSLSLTKSGDNLGTPYYTAPERRRNPRIKSPQSDIYSLGITFLEACTGRNIPSAENLELVPDLLQPIIGKMIRENPNERYHSVDEVIEILDSFSRFRLMYGREPRESESGAMISHVNIVRELHNSLDDLAARCNPDNVLEQITILERKLERLGDAHDEAARTIMNISGDALVMLEEAKPDRLLKLIGQFLHSAEATTERDSLPPEPYWWSKFLTDTFKRSGYRATKHLCLEGLVRLVVRFGDPGSKYHLCLTIQSIEDPSYMEELAIYFREAEREDIATLLDGVPEQRAIDWVALRAALGDWK